MLSNRLYKRGLDGVNRALLDDDTDPRSDTTYPHPYGQKGTEPENVKYGEGTQHRSPKHLPPRHDLRRHIDDNEVETAEKTASLTADERKKIEMEFRNDPDMQKEAEREGLTMDELWADYGPDILDLYYHRS